MSSTWTTKNSTYTTVFRMLVEMYPVLNVSVIGNGYVGNYTRTIILCFSLTNPTYASIIMNHISLNRKGKCI